MVSRADATTTEKSIIDALQRALPDLAPFVAPQFIEGGTRSENWIVQSARGPLFAKVPRANPTPGHARVKRAYPAAVAAEAFLTQRQIETAKVHFFDSILGHLDGRPLLVLDWIEGINGEEYLQSGGSPSAFFEGLARSLATMHARTLVDDFMESLAPNTARVSRWGDVVAGHLDDSHQKLQQAEIRIDASLFELMKRTKQMADEISPFVSPSFCNGNVYPDMVIFPNGDHTEDLVFVDHKACGFRDPSTDHTKLVLYVLPKFDPETSYQYWETYERIFTSLGGSCEVLPERFGVAIALLVLRSLSWYQWVENQERTDLMWLMVAKLLDDPLVAFPWKR